MTKPALHPWLSTPEAVKAARRATDIPATLLDVKARIVGLDELFSEALWVLTECALPPRDRLNAFCSQCGDALEGVRAGAKFCSAACRVKHKNGRRGNWRAGEARAAGVPPVPGGHIGSMWSWPDDRMYDYAVRQVGYCLNNYLRSLWRGATETPASDRLPNLEADDSRDIEYLADDATARQELEEILPAKVKVDGKEPGRDLLECIALSRGLRVTGEETDADLVEAVAHIVKKES